MGRAAKDICKKVSKNSKQCKTIETRERTEYRHHYHSQRQNNNNIKSWWVPFFSSIYNMSCSLEIHCSGFTWKLTLEWITSVIKRQTKANSISFASRIHNIYKVTRTHHHHFIRSRNKNDSKPFFVSMVVGDCEKFSIGFSSYTP